MLGEQIGQDKGKVTNRRVIDGELGPSVEVSFEAQGTILGIEGGGFGTYLSTLRPDGTLFAQGQGIVMAKNGEKITWKGQGVGQFEANGNIKIRGAIYYYSEGNNFKKLNTVAGVYEHEVDVAGNTTSKVWEWK